jgi:hypothetical protein
VNFPASRLETYALNQTSFVLVEQEPNRILAYRELLRDLVGFNYWLIEANVSFTSKPKV